MKNKGIYYLNKSGSRWIVYPNELQWFEIYQGKNIPAIRVQRKPKYWYALGNYAGAVISYKGKAFRAMACEAPDPNLEVPPIAEK